LHPLDVHKFGLSNKRIGVNYSRWVDDKTDEALFRILLKAREMG